MTGSAVGTVGMVDWEWKYWRVGSIVGGSKADWGCEGGIVEVYKWSTMCIRRGHCHFGLLRLEHLDNSC